jgi:hypothetical protein
MSNNDNKTTDTSPQISTAQTSTAQTSTMINEYKLFCIANVQKLPDINKKNLLMKILDADISQSVLNDAIPDLTKKNPATDGTRIFMDNLPDDLIVEIYKDISTCLKYNVVK